MKKLLSIIGIIGLTATTSTAVVSCEGQGVFNSGNDDNNVIPEPNKYNMDISLNGNSLSTDDQIVSTPNDSDLTKTRFNDLTNNYSFNPTKNLKGLTREGMIEYTTNQSLALTDDQVNDLLWLNSTFRIYPENDPKDETSVYDFKFIKQDDGKYKIWFNFPVPNFSNKLEDNKVKFILHSINESVDFKDESFDITFKAVIINEFKFINPRTILIAGQNLPSNVYGAALYSVKDKDSPNQGDPINDNLLDLERSTSDGYETILTLKEDSSPDKNYQVNWNFDDDTSYSPEAGEYIKEKTNNLKGFKYDSTISSNIVDIEILNNNQIKIVPKKEGTTIIHFYSKKEFFIDYDLKVTVTKNLDN